MYIYKTTNLSNGLIYIGQSSKTPADSEKYLGSGRKLKHAIATIGIENFRKEIIELCNSIEQLNEREIYYIELFNSTDPNIGYNILKGGAYPDLSTIIKEALHTPEQQEAMSNRNSKRWEDDDYRKKVTDSNKKTWSNKEKLEQHSDLIKSKLNTPEAKKRRSEVLRAMKKVLCPHCNKTIALNHAHKHFDNCTFHIDPIMRELALEKRKSFNETIKTIECPHCHKTGSVGNMHRWHFNNCKHK